MAFLGGRARVPQPYEPREPSDEPFARMDLFEEGCTLPPLPTRAYIAHGYWKGDVNRTSPMTDVLELTPLTLEGRKIAPNRSHLSSNGSGSLPKLKHGRLGGGGRGKGDLLGVT
ncbi:hypothetical protein E1B28_005075 [Marasmius oreades]|uniref:Uncharacterized protein n=1 Tax=Marasmius oreades TaxID=181124 RepID=A0A9P8ADM2_9AGAR|nr:uncharacterized protein E1B28_005075 [Marasmius oreades]KAG7097754.1 hypothetical protein E1B28_005075 [Marasmius oreades]